MNDDLNINNGRISNINKGKIKKTKLYRNMTVLAVTIASTAVLITMIGRYNEKKQLNPIPENQTKIVLIHEVSTGEDLTSIVNDYYNEDCEDVYRYPKNYMNDIRKQNNVFSDIRRGDKLEIPVIIDKDNQYYVRVLEIEKEISNIEENNLWVDYVVQPGDSFYSLAEKASGDYTETPEISNKIMDKNNTSSTHLIAGTKIKIMNPKLGELKSELIEVNEQLRTSIINGEKTK